MALIDGMLQELEQEAQTTRRVLERVPERSAGLAAAREGEDAGRARAACGDGARRASPSSWPRHLRLKPRNLPDPSPKSASELIPALDESIAKAKKALGGMDDATLMATWRMMQGDRELLAVPRVAMLRSVMLNHWYHHRGQLTVYLRELGVPIPSIYGPSADENPFA